MQIEIVNKMALMLQIRRFLSVKQLQIPRDKPRMPLVNINIIFSWGLIKEINIKVIIQLKIPRTGCFLAIIYIGIVLNIVKKIKLRNNENEYK